MFTIKLDAINCDFPTCEDRASYSLRIVKGCLPEVPAYYCDRHGEIVAEELRRDLESRNVQVTVEKH